jgi:hypothetical protein
LHLFEADASRLREYATTLPERMETVVNLLRAMPPSGGERIVDHALVPPAPRHLIPIEGTRVHDIAAQLDSASADAFLEMCRQLGELSYVVNDLELEPASLDRGLVLPHDYEQSVREARPTIATICRSLNAAIDQLFPQPPAPRRRLVSRVRDQIAGLLE